MKIFLIFMLGAASFFLGGMFTNIEPQVIEVPVYVEKIVNTSTYYTEYVEVEKIVGVGDMELFQSVNELKKFLRDNRISDREGWSCVDYALRMQMQALMAGKLLSTETILRTTTRGHMGNSAVIGDKIYFVEPVSGTVELMGVADTLEITYTDDWLQGKIGDFDWR